MFIRTIGFAAAIAAGAALAAPAAISADKMSDPVKGTKMGNLPYGKAPATMGDPTGTKMTGKQITAKFKGRRTVFVGPQEQGIMEYDANTDAVKFNRATGAETTGNWRVKGDNYCVTWKGADETCYVVYQDAPNSYSLWLENRPAGRVSVH